MTAALVLYVYAYTLIELILDIGAVYFVYRLIKLTGTFRWWVLMIIAVTLSAIQSVGSLLAQFLLFPPEQLEQLILSIGVGYVVYSSIVGLLTAIVFFLAFWELYRSFARVKSRQAAQT